MSLPKPKREPRCGYQHYIKIGTMPGARVYVRRLRTSRSKEIVAGVQIEFRYGRGAYEKWEGPHHRADRPRT